MTPLENTSEQPSDRWQSVLARQLAVLIVLAVLTGIYEAYWYRIIVRFALMGLVPLDWILILGSIVSKTLWMFAAFPLIAALLHRRAATWFVELLGTVVPVFGMVYLCLDVKVQSMLGNHILFFLSVLSESGGMTWAGNPMKFALPAMIHFMLLVVVCMTVVKLLRLDWINNRLVSHPKVRSLLLIEAAILFLGIAPVVWLRNHAPNPLALERLYAAFPASAGLFHWQNMADEGRAAFGVPLDEDFRRYTSRLTSIANAPFDEQEADPLVMQGRKPNVVIFIVECFRRGVVSPQTMPRLDAMAENGLRLKDHYCGSNCSPLGSFSLLHGRTPLGYHATLDADRKPLLIDLLVRTGYHTSLTGSCVFTHRRMEQFLGESVFDQVFLHHGEQPTWPEMDRKCLADISRILEQPSDRPQLIVAYLMSTHYGYEYPASYADVEVPKPTEDHFSSVDENLHQRFYRSARFMDDLLGDFLDVHAEGNLVVVTGDHGESLGEDGFFCHGSRLSRVQTQPDCVVMGPGIEPESIEHPTTHLDIAPTLIHALAGHPLRVPGLHGVDLLDQKNPQPQILVHELTDFWDLLLVDGDDRLMLSLDRREPRLSVRGFADQYGAVQAGLARPPSEIVKWKRTLEKVISRHAPVSPLQSGE